MCITSEDRVFCQKKINFKKEDKCKLLSPIEMNLFSHFYPAIGKK